MYDAWLYYGEYLVLGIWGILLALVRRILFGGLCRDAALGSSGKGKMLRAMTLKFEKSYEVKVGIHDIRAFVQKYLCQERKLGIRLGSWRRLPERWTGLILGVGFVQAMALRYLGYGATICLDEFLAAATAAALIRMAVLWFETDSLWEQMQVSMIDYVANTLYPRQIHIYEGFEETQPEAAVEEAAEAEAAGERAAASEPVKEEKKPAAAKRKKGLVLRKEEEQLFEEVLSDFLGSST